MHLHYCCGEPQRLAMEHEKPGHEDCPLCLTHHGSEKKDTICCTDGSNSDDDSNASCDTDRAGYAHCQNVKVEAKKTTEEHLPSVDKKLAKIYPLELLVFTLAYVIDLPLNIRHAVQTADDGPPNTAVPLFIQHCTYRI